MHVSMNRVLRCALFSLVLGCSAGPPEPHAPATTNARLSADDWRVHAHDGDPAFDRVFDIVRRYDHVSRDLALLSPHAMPRALDRADIEVAVEAGALDRVSIEDLAVLEAAQGGFVILVRGGESFTAQTVVVPADVLAQVHGDHVTLAARHPGGVVSSLMGVTAGAYSIQDWTARGAS